MIKKEVDSISKLSDNNSFKNIHKINNKKINNKMIFNKLIN